MKKTPAPLPPFIVNKLFLNIEWMHGDADAYTVSQHEYKTEDKLKAAMTAVQTLLQYQNDFWNDMCDVYSSSSEYMKNCGSPYYGKAISILEELGCDDIGEYFEKFGIMCERDSTCEGRCAWLESFTAE